MDTHQYLNNQGYRINAPSEAEILDQTINCWMLAFTNDIGLGLQVGGESNIREVKSRYKNNPYVRWKPCYKPVETKVTVGLSTLIGTGVQHIEFTLTNPFRLYRIGPITDINYNSIKFHNLWNGSTPVFGIQNNCDIQALFFAKDILNTYTGFINLNPFIRHTLTIDNQDKPKLFRIELIDIQAGK